MRTDEMKLNVYGNCRGPGGVLTSSGQRSINNAMAGARVYRFNQAAWLAGLFSAFQLSGVMAQTPAAVATPTVAPIGMPPPAARGPDSNFPRNHPTKPAHSSRTRLFTHTTSM